MSWGVLGSAAASSGTAFGAGSVWDAADSLGRLVVSAGGNSSKTLSLAATTGADGGVAVSRAFFVGPGLVAAVSRVWLAVAGSCDGVGSTMRVNSGSANFAKGAGRWIWSDNQFKRIQCNSSTALKKSGSSNLGFILLKYSDASVPTHLVPPT